MAKLIKYKLSQQKDDNKVIIGSKMSKAGLRRWLYDESKFLDTNEKRTMLNAFYDKKINSVQWDEPIISFLLHAAINDKLTKSVGNEIHIKNKIYIIEKEN